MTVKKPPVEDHVDSFCRELMLILYPEGRFSKAYDSTTTSYVDYSAVPNPVADMKTPPMPTLSTGSGTSKSGSSGQIRQAIIFNPQGNSRMVTVIKLY